MSRRRRTPSAEEKALWRLAMRDVAPRRPLSEEPAAPSAPLPAPAEAAPPAPAKPERKARPRVPTAVPRPPHLKPGDLTRMDGRTAERLRRGKADVQDSIDLHGLREHEAHDALLGFILGARARGLQTVLVITGKGGTGGGVIRSRFARWLDDPPLAEAVLGYTVARPRHGGSGAFYLRLRRIRDER